MKKRLTISLEEKDLDYLNIFADEYFEGNQSMAMRHIINQYKGDD